MKESAIRVVVADDQDLVRSGYRAILGTYPDIVVVGDALIQPSVMKRLVERFVATRPRAGAPGLDAGRPLAQTLSGLADR